MTSHNAEVKTVLRQLEEARRHWVDLDNGMRVRFRRPLETELHRFRESRVEVDHVCEYVDGWAQTTGAHILGPELGASDELPFDPLLWSAFVRDRAEHVATVANAIARVVTEHIQAKADAAKN